MQASSTIKVFAALGLVLCLPVPRSAAQDAVADFYKGKQITIMAGGTPGGSAGLYSQAVAHHMGRFLPGNPNFIVQYVPSAGGIVVANNIYNTVASDGTVLAHAGRTVAMEPLLGNTNARFDGRRFGWLGTANVEFTTCIAWHTAQAKTLQDAMNKELVVGGTGADALEVVFAKATNKLVGTRFKIVTGYAGSSEIFLALERAEVEGFCGVGWTFVKLRKAEWLRDKKINILFQMAMERHPDIPDVPLIIDYARTSDDRKIFEFRLAPQGMGRPFFAPPGVPTDRLAALRAAFERTLKDPQFLAEADKTGLEIQHVGGEAVEQLVARIYATPRDVIDRAKAVAE
jgi:tripartite-type tricarboxylate transporter receptor subunit TctC